MSNRSDKQEKFTQTKKSNMTMWVIAAVAIVVVGVGVSMFLSKGGSQASAAYNIGQAVSYGNVEMTDVANTVSNGKVAVALDEVKKAGIIYTEYNQNGKNLALTAWVAPNGDVQAAVSMCEPCRGKKFHIEGNDIVCNTCGTRWNLTTLEGVSGGCLKYPPDKVKFEVKDGKILMDESQIKAWQPRV